MRLFLNIKEDLLSRERSEDGFMGYTHAISALAIVMMCLAFIPAFIPKVVGNDNIWVILMFVLGTIGASMVPDLDNTKSRAKSDMGFFGVILSGFFRVSSSTIQTVIRTSKDDAEPNPHRGFWHTIPASLLLGFLAYLATRVKGEIDLPIFGEMTWGTLFAMLIVATLVNLTLSTLFKEFMDKVRKSPGVGEIVAALISLSISFTLFLNIPKDESFWWVGVAVAFGMIIHILGDLLTTSGVSLFAFIGVLWTGKIWWITRLTKMKAGGAAEKMLVIPVCVVLTVVACIKIGITLFS